MHDFKLKNNKLFCENVPVEKIAGEVGTPAYVYSERTLLDHFNKLKKAFAKIQPLICYSMKANSNLSICRVLAKAGAGIDIVSGGELYRARKIGVNSKKIVYASVGKTLEEIEAAVRFGILFFNVESIPEMQAINTVARRLKKKQLIAIRINPNVEARTHKYITTAKSENKFGIDIQTAKKMILSYSGEFENIEICAIHVHIGSQIEQVGPFIEALKKSVRLIEELRSKGARITHLNIGGGLGIIYNKERPQTADEYARAVMPLIEKKNLKLILEPGRFIVGNAGILLAKITYIKDTPVKRFIIIDAAMNDLLRPTLYGAYHEIIPVSCAKCEKKKKADVVGPVCESGDFLAKGRSLPLLLKSGDILAIMSAGAYGFSMSSNYNSRRRAAEILVNGDKYRIIRKRESYSDLVKNEMTA
ncbi:MAG: diaminopimelate decarboxylase [Candidatus Omnitrophica bacterium]|nr:diaminopimelate decarboxylase [Candidatus Omnitrophota bacterium]